MEEKGVWLTAEQMDLVVKILLQHKEDLSSVLRTPEGLEDTTLRDMALEIRNVDVIVRELTFYSKIKS